MRGRRPERLGGAWPLAFAVFFLISAAWALASPYDGTPDEVRHMVRAAGVAEGQILAKPATDRANGGTGAYQAVPSGLVAGDKAPIPLNNYCYHWIPAQSAACAPVPGQGERTQRTYITGAGRYNPIYYAAVGEPLVLWPNWAGILLARLISAALCAAFLASAWLSCREWRRSPLLIAGLMVATTPMFFEMAGAVNPNSLEMAAGISLAAAAIPLLLEEDSPDARRWLRRAAVAAIGIGQFRALGPALIACLLAVLLLPPVRARLRQLRQLRSARWWSAGVLVSCALGTAWTIGLKASEIGHVTYQYTAGSILKTELTGRLLKLVRQMVDGFSYYDTRPPGLIFTVWVITLGFLLISAFAWGTRLSRWRLTALIAGTLAIPVILELLTVNTFGYSFQGRYMFPIAAGIPLLAAFITGRSGVLARIRQASVVRVMVLILLPFQLISLGYVMDRWQSGVGAGHSLNPLRGSWHPVTGSVLPLLLMTAGLVALGWLAWRASIQADEHSPDLTKPSAELLQVPSA